MESYRPPAHGGQQIWAGEACGADPARWLDFSASLNPLGPPPSVRAALARALRDVAVYPDLQARAATGAIADYLGVDPGRLLVTSGGAEAIFLIVRAFAPAAAIVREPAFGGYREALAAAGVPTVGEQRPLAELLLQDLPERLLLVVGHPANPTGLLEDRATLRALGERLGARGGLLLVDEAFVDFLEDPDAVSLRHAVGVGAGIAVAGSLTKFFTLPGLRIGYALAAGDLMPALRRQQVPWSVSTLAQAAGAAAAADRAFAARSRAFFPPVRQALAQALRDTQAFAVTQGCANFLLLDASPCGIPASVWVMGAARRGIGVRDASLFPGLSPHHLRVAVRTPRENDRLLAALREILARERGAPGGVPAREEGGAGGARCAPPGPREGIR